MRGLSRLKRLMGLTGLFCYPNDCFGHQELENIAHDGHRFFVEFVSWRDGWDQSYPFA